MQGQHEVLTEVLPIDAAKQKGALAFFGDTYGEEVRVVSMGESIEFCGGTHVKNTHDIGMILISQEEAVAAGVRRMEAKVADAAQGLVAQWAKRLDAVVPILAGQKAPDDPVLLAVEKIVTHAKMLQTRLASAGIAFTWPTADTTPDSIPPQPPFSLQTARTLRKANEGLSRLVNAKATQAKEIAATYEAVDSGSLRALAAILDAAKQWRNDSTI